MIYRLLADFLVLLHFGFILFVFLGGLLVFRWRWFMWIHLPCFVWGVLIEWVGWICPLTPWEQWLRSRAGEAAYEGGFVNHYIMPIVYPPGLTREIQWLLGGAVVVFNAVIYVTVFRKLKGKRRRTR